MHVVAKSWTPPAVITPPAAAIASRNHLLSLTLGFCIASASSYIHTHELSHEAVAAALPRGDDPFIERIPETVSERIVSWTSTDDKNELSEHVGVGAIDAGSRAHTGCIGLTPDLLCAMMQPW